MTETAEKKFKYYLKLPTHLRTRIIDKMKTKERCKFKECSKLCNQDAKASLNYAYGVVFTCDDYSTTVSVIFKETEHQEKSFALKFNRGYYGDSPVQKQYFSLNNLASWQVELDIRADRFESDNSEHFNYALEEFQFRVKEYQNSIKMITLYDFTRSRFFEDIDFEIENLRNLKKLKVRGGFDTSQFISKIQHPLQELDIDLRDSEDLPPNCLQIHQVTQILDCRNANLDYEEFQKLSAKHVCIPIGKLNERDIFKFIRSWQNGSIGKDFEVYCWILDNSDFDMNKLLRLLRVRNHEEDQIEIKHFHEAGKSAILSFDRWYLEFNVTLCESLF